MSTQDQLIARITSVLEAEPRVLAAWLYGSHGRGTADAHSDVDIHLVTDDIDGLRADWPTLSDRIGPTVLREPIAGFPAVRHITAQWSRYDIHFGSRASVRERSRDSVTLLFDRVGLHADLRAAPVEVAPDPARVRALTIEFLKVLGQLPMVMHRSDGVYAATWAAMLRIIGIELTLACHPVADPGGASRQYAALPADRRAALAALPAIDATLSSTQDVALACARLFLPLARNGCASEFPTDLYDALRGLWCRELGVDLA